MSITPISVKEAVNSINANSNGWFLPAVQRPFVWGSRYESEKYICKLFDSILNGYPIGIIITWNTSLAVPYREFIQDYEDGKIAALVDSSLWERKDKFLVYDGQQRLQTLYSCLKYTLNKRVLAYNLLYKSEGSDEEYGFEFIDKNKDIGGYVKLPALFAKADDEKIPFKKKLKDPLTLSDEEDIIFESRFDKLWNVFVNKDIKSLAYFSMDESMDENRVNDVFQRLNTGGVPLSGADLLFSKIKETKPSFEEQLIEISKWIDTVTTGYLFSANEILQVINLIVKGTTRIEAAKVNNEEINEFIAVGEKIGDSLKDFFAGFIFSAFNINNSAIISRKLALLPLIVYSYINYQNGIPFGKLNAGNVNKMKEYFILSQLNDWNTQGIIEGGTREIKGEDFPLDKFKEIANNKNRVVDLKTEALENSTWFTLKVMTPNRLFVKQDNTTGRYKPELDHIFPIKLKGRPEDYDVDILWNLQPVSGKTNLLKSNTHPLNFFTDKDTECHFGEYDYLPDNFKSSEWKDHKQFIEGRKKRMIKAFNDLYKLTVN